MTTSLTLDNMLDMAIGSPDASAVNFKVLKTLLRAMLNK